VIVLQRRRPDKRQRHPAYCAGIMPHGWNDSVHHTFGSFIHLLCGERDKGSGRAPLVNPRGPARKSELRTALTSRVPDCGRLDSTYSPRSGTRFTRPIHGTRPSGASASAVQNCSRQFCPVSVRLCPPSLASRPYHPRFGSPISAGTQPLAAISQIKATLVSL